MNLNSLSFDHPWVIAGLLIWPFLWAWRAQVWRRKRRSLQLFASARALDALWVHRVRWPILQSLLGDATLFLILWGVSGPRWGFHDDVVLVDGRDVVLVLDMSQSMRATDAPPTRFDRAREAALSLVGYLRSRPGYRVGIVAFAAEASLLCPLTEDLEFLRWKLEGLSLDDPPSELRPLRANVPSGTSFAAAVRACLMAHDNRTRGFQDSIVLSDGDDPGQLHGFHEALAEAEQAGIPFYTIGIGDAELGESIRVSGRELPVATRLNEYPLEEWARRTRGAYFPARLSRIDLPGMFRQHIEGKDRIVLPGRVPPQPKSQAAWLYGGAVLLVIATALISVRVEPLRAPWRRFVEAAWRVLRRPRERRLTPTAFGLCFSLALLVAAEIPSSLDWERGADQALLERRFADAEALYRRAAERTTQPARVAYKAGLALFQLGQYRDAEQQFRAAAASSSGEARVDALYNLATTLLHRSAGADRRLIEEAITQFDAALRQTNDEARRDDVRTNLELAKLLRLQTADPPQSQPNDQGRSVMAGPSGDRPSTQETVEERSSTRRGDGEPNRVETSSPFGQIGSDRADEQPMPGATREIPRTASELLAPMSPQEARAQVLQALQRIDRQRRLLTRPRIEEAQSYPDW